MERGKMDEKRGEKRKERGERRGEGREREEDVCKDTTANGRRGGTPSFMIAPSSHYTWLIQCLLSTSVTYTKESDDVINRKKGDHTEQAERGGTTKDEGEVNTLLRTAANC